MMRKVKISLLAVDESHCISQVCRLYGRAFCVLTSCMQWGASFRPEYLKIARFADELDVERVLCLTATATRSVAEDICRNFYIHPTEGVFRIPVYRPKYVTPFFMLVTLTSWTVALHCTSNLRTTWTKR